MCDSLSVTAIIRQQADRSLATGNVERATMLLELALEIEEHPLTHKKLSLN